MPRTHRLTHLVSSRVPRLLRVCGPALALASALGAPNLALAQVSGTAGLASTDRYRGLGSDGDGPVLSTSVTADSSIGLYASTAAHWNFREGTVADADGLIGFSRRFADPAEGGAIDAAWAWDVAVHRRLEGDQLVYASTEWMAGLLGPGFQARVWWSPDYDSLAWSTEYFDLGATRAIGAHWHAYAHVGYFHYDRHRAGSGFPYRPADRTDARVGVNWTQAAWSIGLARDALLSGVAYGTTSQRHAAWIASVEVAF